MTFLKNVLFPRFSRFSMNPFNKNVISVEKMGSFKGTDEMKYAYKYVFPISARSTNFLF